VLRYKSRININNESLWKPEISNWSPVFGIIYIWHTMLPKSLCSHYTKMSTLGNKCKQTLATSNKI
jgi:hypothetical protein